MIMDQETVILCCKYLHHTELHIGAYRYGKNHRFQARHTKAGRWRLSIVPDENCFIMYLFLMFLNEVSNPS